MILGVLFIGSAIIMGDSHNRKGAHSAQDAAYRKIFIGGLSYSTDDGKSHNANKCTTYVVADWQSDTPSL